MTLRILFIAMAVGAAVPAQAQRRSEPQILLSIFGGMGGGADLWEVNRQPLLILGTETLPIPAYDTIRVSRRIRPGLVAGVNATYFPTPHVGIVGEISLIGLGIEDRCTLIAEDTGNDPQRRNKQVCDDMDGRTGAASAVAFQVGAVARAGNGLVVPFLRAQGGFTSRQSSLTELSGRFVNQPTGASTIRGIYLHQGGGVAPAAMLGLGLMAQVSPGYQFRLEVRDHVIRVQDVTGPTTLANPGLPPVASRFINNFALLVHFDIVLERRRGRRY